jgi:RNA polymerase sigma-70 factor (ECF subfamily)
MHLDTGKHHPEQGSGPEAGHIERSGSHLCVGDHVRDSYSAEVSDGPRQASALDRKSLATAYMQYRRGMLCFAVHKYKLDYGVAEDIVQDVFLRFLQREYGQITVIADVRSYLLSMLRSAVVDLYRKRKAAMVDLSANTPSSEPRSDAIIEGLETASQVAEAMSTLTESHRRALDMRLAGLSYQQIASRCGCTVKAARRRAEKAREQLKMVLSRCGCMCVISTDQGACSMRRRGINCLKWSYVLTARREKHTWANRGGA